MSADHSDRRAREDHRNEHHVRHPNVTRLPQRDGLILLEVQVAQAQALTGLNDRAVRAGRVALPLQDPRDLAWGLLHAARRARNEVVCGDGDDLVRCVDEVAAYASALRLALARVEAIDPTTGGEAA